MILTWFRPITKYVSALGILKQRYGTELRSKTLASIKPEISQALNSLLDEVYAPQEATAVLRSAFIKHDRVRYKQTPVTPAKCI